MAAIIKERHALVVCDMQADLLTSLDAAQRSSLLESTKCALDAARRANWLIVFCGLRFPSGYAGVNPRHKLYGGFQRLNAKMGDKSAHWFMNGYPGSEIESSLPQEGDTVVWRQRHLPAAELLQVLRAQAVTTATVIGIKASYSIQVTCQVLCDEGLNISVVRDCVSDDKPERLAAVLDHVLPVYATVISLHEMIDDMMGVDEFVQQADEQSRKALAGTGGASGGLQKDTFYFTNCDRGGHDYFRFLLERPGWQSFPTQTWYGRLMKEYLCPLGRKVVDFSDEPEFSAVSMYLSGREWLDEKDMIVKIAGSHMSETFVFDKGTWANGRQPPADSDVRPAPWFVKESDKNWGSCVEVCLLPSQAIALAKPEGRYVVQQHVPDPLLTDDGRKAHIKFYILLLCEADGITWRLYTYKSAYLSISPNAWKPDDVSAETQVTILRHPVPAAETEGWKQHWPDCYAKSKEGTVDIVQRAIAEGKLKGRPGKKQFEVFSADWMPDIHGKVWLFECNMSPKLCQHQFAMEHDEKMLRDALSLAIPWDGSQAPGHWDFAKEFIGSNPEVACK